MLGGDRNEGPSRNVIQDVRRLSWTLAIYILLLAGAVGTAEASHPTHMCLDLTEEHVFETSNDDMIRGVQAWPGATDADHPPQHQGCVTELVEQGQDWTGTNIDFEIVGASDPDNADSPTTPDMTCTVGPGGSGCSVYPPSASEGMQTIRGWIDFDLDDETVEEVDTTEGQDETSSPGAKPDPDATDVVLWHWETMDTTSESAITMRYVRGSFRGAVESSYGPCTVDRTINVFKRRAGGRRLIGTATTDENGAWRLAGSNVHGRFFAVATETTRHTASPSTDMTCLRDRSSTIRVD